MPKDVFIRFEVQNVKQKLYDADSIESDVIWFEGLCWGIFVRVDYEGTSKQICLGLKCYGAQNAKYWSCNVCAELRAVCRDPYAPKWTAEINEIFNQGKTECSFVFNEWSMALNPQRGYIHNGMLVFEATVSPTSVFIKNSAAVIFWNIHDLDETFEIKCARNKSYDNLVDQVAKVLDWDPLELQLFDVKGQRLQPAKYPTLRSMIYNQHQTPCQLFFQKMKQVPVVKMVDKSIETSASKPFRSDNDKKLDVFLTEKNTEEMTFVEAFADWSYGQFAAKVGRELHHDPYLIQFYNNKKGAVGEALYPNLNTSLISMAGLEGSYDRRRCSFFYRKIRQSCSDQHGLSCPICFDTSDTIASEHRNWYSTKCGHIFCGDCIERAYKKHLQCPKCRMPLLSRKEFHVIFI